MIPTVPNPAEQPSLDPFEIEYQRFVACRRSEESPFIELARPILESTICALQQTHGRAQAMRLPLEVEDLVHDTVRSIMVLRRKGDLPGTDARRKEIESCLERLARRSYAAMLMREELELAKVRDLQVMARHGMQCRQPTHVDELAAHEDLLRRCRKLLGQMPSRPRRKRDLLIFSMVFFDGHSFEQVAVALTSRPKVTTVAKAYYRVRRELLDQIKWSLNVESRI